MSYQLTGLISRIRRRTNVAVPFALVTLAGCFSFGAPAMHYDIQQYNKDALSGELKMLLFNIGELHDHQPPHFMMLSEVDQSRAFTGSAGFQWSHLVNSLFIPTGTASGITDKGSNTWQAGPFTLGASESPITKFNPIQGQEFAQRFESPLTDKFTLFLEDRAWFSSSAETEALFMLFAQSLYLSHGDQAPCGYGLYVNKTNFDPQEQNDAERRPKSDRTYYDEAVIAQRGSTRMAECVNEIVSGKRDYELIDGNRAVPTRASDDPKAADLVTALQAGYKWAKIGGDFKLANPVRIPAWFDYTPSFVPPSELKSESPEALPLVWHQSVPPKWKDLAYLLPKSYQWKAYRRNKNDKEGAAPVYALVPDGYDLERYENGSLKLDEEGNYIPTKVVKPVVHDAAGTTRKDRSIITDTLKIDAATDKGKGITGAGIAPNTVIIEVDAKAKTATMSKPANASAIALKISVGDVNDFPYTDKVVSGVWPVPQNYLYVELRKGAVDGSTAERDCFSNLPADSAGGVVCGYFKIGNLLQIMQRLADMACHYKDDTEIAAHCSQSIFGFGRIAPHWADNTAHYDHGSIWVPAHNPTKDSVLADRDRLVFFTLYKLYQTALVDTSKLVTGTTPISITR